MCVYFNRNFNFNYMYVLKNVGEIGKNEECT